MLPEPKGRIVKGRNEQKKTVIPVEQHAVEVAKPLLSPVHRQGFRKGDVKHLIPENTLLFFRTRVQCFLRLFRNRRTRT